MLESADPTNFRRNAQKLRKEIERNIEPLKRGASEKSVIVQLKKLEEDLAEYVISRVRPRIAHI